VIILSTSDSKTLSKTGEEKMKIAAYDNQAIWGVGETVEAAIADARKYRESGVDGLDTAEMTESLAATVDENGGNCAFGTLTDGRLCTAGEEYDAA